MSQIADSKPTITEVTTWLRAMSERGILNATTVRLRVTAIEQLVTVLADDEPGDAESVAKNIEAIARRWATKNNGKPETMKDYMTRARGGLSDFFEYRKDPGAFQPSAKRVRSTNEEVPSKAPKEAKLSKTEAPPPATQSTRSFPLGHDNAFFEYSIPEGWTVRDAVKVFYHLMTYAQDFDPTNPQQAKIFALVRTEAQDSSDAA